MGAFLPAEGIVTTIVTTIVTPGKHWYYYICNYVTIVTMICPYTLKRGEFQKT